MKKAVLALAGLCAMGSASAERWNKGNNPNWFNILMKTKISYALHTLPLKASLRDDRLGWSENFWPANKGGIAYRWNDPLSVPFNYTFYKKEQLMSMSQEQLSKLSPAELYDIANGDEDYTLTKKIIKGQGMLRGFKALYTENDDWWEGICHGWSQAAVNYPEPKPVSITNKWGMHVPFGSSDVKGLLAMHDAFNSKGQYARVGEKCRAWGKVPGEAFPEDIEANDGQPIPYPSQQEANSDECRDVNAGAFHVVITNMIGVNSQGFVAEVDRFNDVWNQPVVGYDSALHEDRPLTAQDLSNGVARKVRVTLDMTYADELEFKTEELVREGVKGFVSKLPVTGTPAQTFGMRKYEYVLELDVIGNIIGGEWISISRPDMLWMKAKDPKFLDARFPLAGLNVIYRPVKR